MLNELAIAGEEPRARPADALLPGLDAERPERGAGVHHRPGVELHLPAQPAATGQERPDQARRLLHVANDTKIPNDPASQNGWTYLNADNTSLQVYGAWCDMIKSAGADKVKIIYGCTDFDVP